MCPYYINTGMFAGIGKSLIPILTPEYVVNETVKAVLVNQEVLYLPSIVYFLLAFKSILNPKSFTAAHKAIGAASTMKTFVGRTPPNQGSPNHGAHTQTLLKPSNTTDSISIKMAADDVGINMPDPTNLKQAKGGMQLNQ